VGKDLDRDREGVSVMLQITDTAASAFRDILAREEVGGQTIRLVPETTTNGQGGISLEAINEPAPADAEASAQGVRVVVAQELASTLDDAVLDAKPTEQGTEFFIRSQPA
jgi:Fe-S cluster assembly iron-binding protein IscA